MKVRFHTGFRLIFCIRKNRIPPASFTASSKFQKRFTADPVKNYSFTSSVTVLPVELSRYMKNACWRKYNLSKTVEEGIYKNFKDT